MSAASCVAVSGAEGAASQYAGRDAQCAHEAVSEIPSKQQLMTHRRLTQAAWPDLREGDTF